MLEEAIRKKKQIGFENQRTVLLFLSKNPGLSTYEISRKMKWSTGKVKWYLIKLLKKGYIKNESRIINGRNNILYYPVKAKEFINWDEMKYYKKP